MPKLTIEIGTVSHGTLRTPDLLRAFADTLAGLAPHTYANLIQDAHNSAREIDADPRHPGNEQCGIEIVHELIDALNGLAPDGVYLARMKATGQTLDFGE